MFLLTTDERQEIIRGLLPRARRREIPEDLRGWSWGAPPVATTSDMRLGAWELGRSYCDTSRDVFLRRIAKIPSPPSPAMRRGRCLHGVAVDLLVNVKQMIYTEGVSCLIRIERDLAEPPERILSRWVDFQSGETLRVEAVAVWRYLHRGILVALQEALSAQPRHSADSLVAAALPVVAEWKIDGHRIGLSSHLSVDVLTLGSPILLKAKVALPSEGHRLQLAAYALAAESVYEVPFDLAAISYVTLDGPHVRVIKDLFIVDDLLREAALDERDTKIALIEQVIEPPVSRICPCDCPYLRDCHSESKPAPPQGAPLVAMPSALGNADLEAHPPGLSQIEPLSTQ